MQQRIIDTISSARLGFPLGTSIASAADGLAVNVHGYKTGTFYFDLDHTTATEITWKISVRRVGSTLWMPYSVPTNEGSGAIRYHDYIGKKTVEGDTQWAAPIDLADIVELRLEDVTGSTSDTIEIYLIVTN